MFLIQNEWSAYFYILKNSYFGNGVLKLFTVKNIEIPVYCKIYLAFPNYS